MEQVSLLINDRNYEVIIEQPGLTLLTVLRDKLALTGTKCGCITGDCGACKVLLDGEPVNACTVLARKAGGHKIITIEGLAASGELHPIQQAFIEVGAVQCGYCTPGMIMTAKALLDKDPNPTEETVRLALNENLCRCTGYKKIVEAILLAAKYLSQGLKPLNMAEINSAYVGQKRPIRDAAEKVQGQTCYTGDMSLPGMLHGKMLYSPVAHARIKAIDTSKALALPGVRAVATCFNTPTKTFNSALRFKGHTIPADENIFPPVVRYVGDRVAAVAADTPELAAKALKLIEVEYEQLPAVFDPEEAMLEQAPHLHGDSNVLGQVKGEAGDVEQAFAEADYVMEERYTTPAVHHYAIEPHACLANWDGKKLTIWTAAQNIFAYRVILAELFDLPQNKVRIIKPPVGGGFGGKLEAVLEPVAGFLSMQTGKPVKMELTRKECMVSTRTRHAAVVYVKTGVKKDGTLTALDFKVITNTGAYASSAFNVLGAMSSKAFMLYRAPNIRFSGCPVYTNTPVGGAMRGYGSPQLFTALELHMDQVAQLLGVDPLEFRLKNLVRLGDPHPRSGNSLGNCRVIDCVEKGNELFGWQKSSLRSQVGASLRGIGLAVGVHGNGVYPAHTDQSTATIKMLEDGSVVLFTGNQDIGQGSITAFTQIISEVLGVSLEMIEVIEADTELTSFDLGTYASRGIWVSAEAVRRAAVKVKEQLLEEATVMLDVPVDKLKLVNGRVINQAQLEQGASLSEVVVYAQQRGSEREIIATDTYHSAVAVGSYGVHFAEVEVQPLTGEVKVLRYVAVHDVGKAINPLMVEGQIEGGIQMGLGYALCEELKLDLTTGKVLNAHPKRYPIFKANDMPELTVAMVDEAEIAGPFGGKSIGEAATVPVAAAVINAVNNALGTRFKKLPVTPEDIKKAWTV